MPDVIVTCRECGAERTISEYAAIDRLTCLICRAPLEKPANAGKGNGLGLRRPPDPKAPPVPLTNADPPKAEADPLAVVEEITGNRLQDIDVHAGRAEESKNRNWIATLAFMVVALLLVGFQFKHEALSAYTNVYLWTRGLLAAGVYLLVVLVAFQDSLGSGSLCLFVPPYAVVYAGASVESHVLRGAFFAVLLALCTEVYFIRDQSMAMALAHNLNGLIETVDSLIVRASM